MFRRFSGFRANPLRVSRCAAVRAARRGGRRPGLTLLELVIAMSIMVMIVGTLGALAKGVHEGFEYAEGHATATQHARVVLERIARTVREAAASEQFPGVIVLAETEGSWRFPDTLVVWHPEGDPADPDGLPLFSELVIYCPHTSLPNQFVEITVPGDTRPVPPVDNQAQWAAEIDGIKTSNSSRMVTLTGLMRTCSLPEAADATWRGAARFERRLRPTQEESEEYRAGNLEWDELSWVQGIYGSQTGLRQVWLRIELQLMPAEGAAAGAAGQRAVPFFGSAALYYEVHK